MSVALVGPPAPLPLLPPPCPSFFFSIKEGKYIAFLKQLKEGLILATVGGHSPRDKEGMAVRA